MPSNKKIYWALGILLFLSAAARAFITGFIELGNDEVYYWTYARFPDLSHFDHPPMVGLIIQLFTLNLHFESEIFIRLASVIFGTLSTYVIFLIGKQIKNPVTGLYAALLYTSSFYGFILCGTFILPDTPQVFFWLSTIYLLVRSVCDASMSARSRNFLFLAGVSAGLALLSKYHSVFLLAGTFMYMLFYNRKWFLVKETYGAIFVALLIFIPVVFWNANNDFISFTFHEKRVGITESGIQPQYFLTELVGQFFYNNPVNVIIILFAMLALIRKRNYLEKNYLRLIGWISFPLFLVFLTFSLFRSTLPHWTGPAYLGFILLAAAYLSETKKRPVRLRLIPWPVAVALIFLAAVITLAVGQIRYGWIPLKRWKVDDVSTDLYGWKQLGEKFAPLARWDESHFLIDKDSPILTFRWFPAANFDYYVARPMKRSVYCLGELERIHKYYWINRERGNLSRGSDAWYIALSDDYENPVTLYGSQYDMILLGDTIPIIRGTDTIRKAYLYRLIDRKENLILVSTDTLPSPKKNKTIQDTILFLTIQIRSDPMWMKILQKKATEQGMRLDDLIRLEVDKIIQDQRELKAKPIDSLILRQRDSLNSISVPPSF